MVGQSLAHYRIVERIGAGGMGVVYKAEDLRLGRVVALKFLSPELASSPTAVERFLREARTASSLNHPNICTIYSIEECEGQRFLAMELLEGRSLVEVIGGRPMAPETVVELGIQIADALDAAHAQGVLHRDVKPANIFVTRRGLVKVLDFGLAKLALLARDSDAQDSNPTMAEMLLTTQGLALGTVAYMSPEQARGEPLDARSDIFSFGIVLYEMLTGQQAFSGRTSAVVFDAILNREPAALSLFRHDLPPVLDAIVTRALDKDVTGRFQSMAAARDALARLKRERESGQFLAVSPDLARSSDSASFLVSTPADLSASSRVPPASRAGAPVPDVPEDVDDETLSEDDTPTLIGRPPTISSPPSAGTFVPADSSPLSSGLSPVPTSLVSAGPEGVAVVAPIEALSPVVAASAASPTVVGAATVAAPGVALPAPAVRPSSTAPGRSKTPVALALIGAVVVVGAIGAWWALRNRPEPVPVPAVEAPAAVLPDAPLPVNAAAQQAIAAAAAGAVPADVRGAAVASRRQRAAVPRATPGPAAPVPAAAAPLSGTAIMPALPRASPQRVDPAALLLTAARTKYEHAAARPGAIRRPDHSARPCVEQFRAGGVPALRPHLHRPGTHRRSHQRAHSPEEPVPRGCRQRRGGVDARTLARALEARRPCGDDAVGARRRAAAVP